MTTVQELSLLHRRYADTSHRFRASWTFHQFLQSLGKTLLQRVEDPHSTEFQDLYTGLKEISQNLNASESERIRHRLEAIDRRLTELISLLSEEDTKVTPDLLRQFFRRVKNYDEKILSQLVRFYLYAHAGGLWPSDRLDKVDFLLARLSEELDDRTGELVLRNHHRLNEIFQGIWAQLAETPPGDQAIEERRADIDAVRHEMSAIESLDRLNESGLIRRYRDLKHGLATWYFFPDLLLPIQETNLVFKARIHKLYRQEEQRIIAEYQRVFELEREVPFDTQLDRELGEFREEIERFEKQLQREEFRLGDIALIRQRVKDLLPRLAAGRNSTVAPSSPQTADTGEYTLVRAGAATTAPLRSQEELLGDHYRRLVDVLRDVNPPDLAPERVVLKPEVFALRIEVREVEAYRRIFGKGDADRELEQFLLESAALRIRINEEAQEIASLLDETSVTGDSVVFARARLTARVADSYLWRFNHVLNELMQGGNFGECRQVQLLRMRLMRDYSGLWLLAFKPLYKRVPAGTLA
ncbi:MAG TPA: hypothetical protein VF173_16880 [Thermoanaerobaculia bacterium]|nr:hypothetical protein [Thermoanaerobaculia bacterium]